MTNPIKIGTAFSALALSMLGLLAAPTALFAQDRPTNPDGVTVEKRIVSLDLEDADLYAAFQAVFKQAKTSYALDPTLKNNRVTIHIKLPMRQAIAMLLKNSGLNYTLIFENGVYGIVRFTNDADLKEITPNSVTATDVTPEAAQRLRRVALRRMNSIDFAMMLGLPVHLYTSSLIYHGRNPFAPGSDTGAPAPVPGAAGGATSGGSGKSGGANTLLPKDETAYQLFASDADTTALFALFRGL